MFSKKRSYVANARIGKPETFFSLSLTIIESFKTFITDCLKRTKNAYSSRGPKKNIGKGMLATVQMRYFENYQIFFKTFENF